MRARKRGFTLIEVMVALLIVGLGMLGVIKIVSQTASTSGYLREKTLAHWVAMNRLTEVRLQKNAPAVDKTSDEVEMGGRKWKWTMNVTQTPVETIRRIDVSVRPEGAPENTEMASVTGFFGTAVAPPGTALIAWQGVADGAPQKPGDKDKDDEEQDQPNEPPPEELPPEPEEPPDGIDPSDPTQH
ncbi:MAG TPA: type II secretion system minor pseudopilin GspI [Steroidobacteraceae bacterium]|jgi:general secretion pathway protein I|nr:type II secretion system minor pseudopilin GspI [Steroidobacteraceae bacterium]